MPVERHAYEDPGTPEEISRRSFMVRATIFTGTIVGLGLAVPLIDSLIPKTELIEANKGFSPLSKTDFAALEASLEKPVKIFFHKLVDDGYYKEDTEYYVWGIKLSDDDLGKLRSERPELFDAQQRGDIDYPIGNLGFVMFSPLCPHLNCKYDWNDSLKGFLCPCHGSQFTKYGSHKRDSSGKFIGPAPRGLDPLPFAEKDGMARVEWIKYAANQPSIVRVSYW